MLNLLFLGLQLGLDKRQFCKFLIFKLHNNIRHKYIFTKLLKCRELHMQDTPVSLEICKRDLEKVLDFSKLFFGKNPEWICLFIHMK